MAQQVELTESVAATDLNKSPLDTVTLENPEIVDNSYKPQSETCASVDTVVPASMAYDMHRAIETIDRKVSGVDEYVAEKLGYIIGKCSIEQRKEGLKCLCDAFSAEQVDAIMVAIYNIEVRGQACIIGDQTGIGKGRIAAGMIRYGILNGYQPIFLTEKPNLFSDLFRDIIAIGSDDAVPLEILQGYKEVERSTSGKDGDCPDDDCDEDDSTEDDVTIERVAQYKANKNYASDIKGKKRCVPYIVNGRNAKTAIKDEQGNVLYKGLAKNENDNIIAAQKVPKEYNFILATYSQFRGASVNLKMSFLQAVSQGNIIIMDESHNASGSSNTGTFLRGVLEGAQGASFLSATFAKRPDNMPIYASKTTMADANMTNEQLVIAIEMGGVALQEIVSSQLVSEGQMIRRERSFEGVEVNWIYLNESQDLRGFPNLNMQEQHRAIMDSATDIIREIINFQIDYVQPIIESMDEVAKAEYKQVEKRKGTVEAGAGNTPVFSGVFNIINQLLFSIKAEGVAQVAIARLKEGKKPVIAFASTMESFLNTLTNDDGTPVSEGDLINPDFSKVFERRLDSVLKYTVIESNGERKKESIDINSQDPEFRMEYNRIRDKIKSTSIGISSSPIDVLTDAIEKAGYSVAEVTGRDRMLQFTPSGQAKIKNRIKQTANDAFRMFNNNEVDCLLINQSGSTGASAHALPSAKVPKEKVRQRVMIILQAELNINTEVQKRGRINRTGQIFKPIYDYVISAIPAEQRLMMMLQNKLKSLDANTTSNQKQSKKVLDVNDFLNKYGDIVVVEFLKDNPLINKQIGDPLKMEDAKEGDNLVVPDAAHKVSGRIAILPIKDQELFYREMTERYSALADYLIQTGEYDLEVENLNLEAETIEKEIVIVGKGGDSVFGRHSILEKVKVNNLRKPFTKAQLKIMLKESLDGFTPEALRDSLIEKHNAFMKSALAASLEKINQRYANLIKDIPKEKAIEKMKDAKSRAEAIAERKKTLEAALETTLADEENWYKNRTESLNRTLSFFTVGKVIGYPSVTFSQDGSFTKGIFLGFDINEGIRNPFAPSAIKLRFAIAGTQKYIAVPASKYDVVSAVRTITYEQVFEEEGMVSGFVKKITGGDSAFLNKWDDLVKAQTVDRITRYIVTGNILQAFGKPELKGSLVSYTTKDGGLKKGILLPEGFSKEANRETDKKALRITVPIGKALDIIKSMREGRAITTTDGLTIIRTNDAYKIMAPASKVRGGKFYLNSTIMKLTTEGEFNKVADQMTATVALNKIANLVNFVQDEFSSSVELSQSEFDQIKDSISMEDYSDEVRKPEPIVFIETLKEVDTKEAEKRLEEEKIKEQAQKETQEQEIKARFENLELDRKRSLAKGKLIKLLKLMGENVKREGGSLQGAERFSREQVAMLIEVYQVAIEGEKGVIDYLKSQASERYYFENNLSRVSAMNDQMAKIERIEENIAYLEKERYPYDIHSRFDLKSLIRHVTEFPGTTRGHRLLDSKPAEVETYQSMLKKLTDIYKANYKE